LLPEPTCRHGGCPLRHSGTARSDRLQATHCAPYRLSRPSRLPSRPSPRPTPRTIAWITTHRRVDRGADSLCGTTAPVTGHRSAALRFRDLPSPHRDSPPKPGRVEPPQLPHQPRDLALCDLRGMLWRG
jgi:hypothetical protein